MPVVFHQLFKRLMRIALSAFLLLSLLLSPYGGTALASNSLMSGDFAKDTVLVAQSLKDTIAIPDDSENREEAESEALELITGYILIILIISYWICLLNYE